jgi:hypothetical protein
VTAHEKNTALDWEVSGMVDVTVPPFLRLPSVSLDPAARQKLPPAPTEESGRIRSAVIATEV